MGIQVDPAIRLTPMTENCYVCGPRNAGGLHVTFAVEEGGGSRGVYTARVEHCGWPGLLHGGVAFALMDEALAWALYFQGLYGVTARVETRFRQPVGIGTRLIIRAWTLDRRRRLVNARSEMRLDADDGLLVAEADAAMYLQDIDVIKNI
jgi:acyl-coenzyme A thioesterase PaaI-like protein